MTNRWEKRIPDLSERVLTLDEKTWLANRVIINGEETVKELHLK